MEEHQSKKRKIFIETVGAEVRKSEYSLKIIFLDIDGVIYFGSASDKEHRDRIQADEIKSIKNHSTISKKIPKSMLDELCNYDLSATLGFSEKALTNLKKLCDTHNAKIVISSSWRDGKSIEKLKALFSIHDLDEYIIDMTAKLRTRGEEIEKWLFENSNRVSSFVILDDVKFDLEYRFKERFVHCEELFHNDMLLSKAQKVLEKNIREDSEIYRLYNAIKHNSSKIKSFELNLNVLSFLKIYFQWETQKVIDHLFSLLKTNTHITHLTFRHIDYENDSNNYLNKVATLLKETTMKLEYLDLAHNGIDNLDILLSVIYEHNLHVPHICLNANPIQKQDSLAAWIKSYPSPIKLDLDLSNSGYGLYSLTQPVIDALVSNPNVSIYTKEDLIPASIDADVIDKLSSLGRLELGKKQESCCIM